MPTLGAVEGDPVALPRSEGAQRVRHGGAAGVVDDQVEAVLDGDAVVEHVEIALVAVGGLGVEVEALQQRVGGQVQSERIGRVVVAAERGALAQSAGVGVGLAVELQAAAGVHPGRHVGQPPVDQVEVVGALVHEQTAGDVLTTVPAAEVVGAVGGVEQPLEVHRGDVTDGAVGDQLADHGVARGVAVVERHRQIARRGVHGVHDPAQSTVVDRHRLLGDHIQPALQGGGDVDVVGGVGGGDDQGVRSGLVEQPGQVLGGVGGHLGQTVAVAVVVHPDRVGIAEGHQLAHVGVGAGQRPHVHPRPRPSPYDRVPPTLVDHLCSSVSNRFLALYPKTRRWSYASLCAISATPLDFAWVAD